MKVTFYGGAQEVGRSCVMVSTDRTRILLDAGVKLGEVEERPLIKDETIKTLDGVFISHSHLDHIGYLPHIFSRGFRGFTYAIKPTMEITNVQISDYMRLSQPKEVTKEGLTRLQKSYKICEFNQDIKIKDLTIRFLRSGHIVGSSMISVSDGKSTLLYSGDINLAKTRLLEIADTRNLNAKTLIVESTYGAEKDVFPNENDITQKMLKSIKDTLIVGGKVIIPSFSVGRAQEVLLMLDDYINSGIIPKVPVYVDGMINKVMRIYRHNVIYCKKELQMRILMSDYDPFKSSNFVPIESKAQRTKVAASDEACIIVTTSGMLTGGPVLYYLQRLGHNSTNKMIFVGYQADATLGRKIQEGAREVKIDGKNVKLNLAIENAHMSAHADRRQLETYIKKVNGLRNVFIMHGEKSKSEELREWASRKYKAIVPRNEETYEI